MRYVASVPFRIGTEWVKPGTDLTYRFRNLPKRQLQRFMRQGKVAVVQGTPYTSAVHDDHTYLDESGRNAILPPPILTSPNGSHYRLVVNDLGALSTDFVSYDPDPAGASGTGYMSESGARLISSSSYAFKGDPMVPDEPFTITALHTDIETVAGGTYRGIVLIGDTVVEKILGQSELVTAATTGLTHMNFPMNVNVQAGQEVVVLTGRTDAGGAYVLPQDAYDGARSGFTWQGIPATDVGYSCSRIASANPQVGTAIDRGKGYNSAPFNIQIDWTQAS